MRSTEFPTFAISHYALGINQESEIVVFSR